MSALHDLAAKAGLQVDWQDATGRHHRVGDDTLIAVLDAMGLAADSDRSIDEAQAALAERAAAAQDFITGDVDEAIRVRGDDLPDRGELLMEDGERRVVTLDRDDCGGRLTGATVEPITTVEYPTPATRPANSRLDCARFAQTFGYRAPQWQHSCEAVVRRLLA